MAPSQPVPASTAPNRDHATTSKGRRTTKSDLLGPAHVDGVATGFLDVEGIGIHVGTVNVDIHPASRWNTHPTSTDPPGAVDGSPATGVVAPRPTAKTATTATTATTQGPTVGVILLHHFYGNVMTWRRVMRGLAARGIAAIAVDRPGFGWSQRPTPAQVRACMASGASNPYSRAFGVTAARAAVIAAGWDEVVIVGSSMGGTLAIELAHELTTTADSPAIRHLVLLSPALTGDVGVPAPLREVLRAGWIRRAMRPIINRLSRRIDLDRVSGGWHDQRLAGQTDIDAYRIPSTLPGWAAGIWQVMTVESPPNHKQMAVGLDVPTTVVAGRHDRTISPQWNHRTAQGMRAELVEIDTGHTPQEEAPTIVVDLVADRISAATGTVRAEPAN